MKKYSLYITIIAVLVLAVGSYFVLQTEPPRPVDPHGHGDSHDEHGNDAHDDHDADAHGDDEHGDSDNHGDHASEPSGAHGGRQLTLGEFSIEVSIFETGVPPEFRLYITDKEGHPVTVEPSATSILLKRPDRTDRFTFRAADEFLQSEQEVGEPHEFSVTFVTTIAGQKFDTSYYQEEAHGHEKEGEGSSLGSIVITEEALTSNNIRLMQAGPGRIAQLVELPGEILLNADKVAHIVPRFPGIAQTVYKNLGDEVTSGDVLAVIQSNQSVAPYDVKSLVSGTIIEKHITLGEFVRDDADIYVVADLSTVWVKISVYAKYLGQINVGQRVRLTASGIDETAEGVIDYVGPIVGERTRTGQARVVLNNRGGAWVPGLFVTAAIAVSDTLASIAVPDDAIQTVEGKNAVFVREGDRFHARTVTLGRSDGKMIEILAGLSVGETYAASNSFVLKADFGKSEAGHDH